MRKIAPSSTQSALIRASALAGLITISAFVTRVLIGGLSLNEVYQVLLTIAIIVFYLTVVPSFLWVILGRARGRLLLRSVTAISSVALAILILLGFGVAQDAVGAKCTDLWGWHAKPCTEVMQFWVFYYLLLPVAILPASVISSALLAAGLVNESKLSKQKSKNKPRRATVR